VLATAALGLCACSQPSWRDPAKSHGTAVPQPDVLKVAHIEATTQRGTAKADHVIADGMPPPPEWAADLIGKGLRTTYPNVGDCIGNTDSVKVRFGGGVGGSKIAGWGWDPATKAPVPRVVLADRNFQIEGAGETGARRKDVPKAVASVTSDYAGWEALTPLNAGPLDAWGVLADGKTICRLGHIDL
jgi:hypothetical protein